MPINCYSWPSFPSCHGTDTNVFYGKRTAINICTHNDIARSAQQTTQMTLMSSDRAVHFSFYCLNLVFLRSHIFLRRCIFFLLNFFHLVCSFCWSLEFLRLLCKPLRTFRSINFAVFLYCKAAIVGIPMKYSENLNNLELVQ